MNIYTITDMATLLVCQHVQNGGRVIDATAGNGHDTLALARAVGDHGEVYAFDIQQQALDTTRELLESHQLEGRVELILASHSQAAEYVSKPVDAVMFNLGYLPRADKNITTHTETTMLALSSTFDLLEAEGLMSIVTYPGHEEGAREHEAVVDWLATLETARVSHYEVMHLKSEAPQLFLAQKRREKNE